jgi:Tol biopolymer transport system component
LKNGMVSTCLVVALLLIVVLVPQAVPPAAAELAPEQAQRRMAGRIEPLPYLDRAEDTLRAESPQAPDSLASWSKLTFQSFRDGGWEIYRADGDGSNQVRLTRNDVSDIQPELDRGASRIAFATYRTNNYYLYAMNEDGSGKTQLTFTTAHEVNPAWSPDGSRLAYESYQTGSGDIYVMNAGGGGQVRLTSDAAWDGEPAWSPDGTRIAFTSYRNSVYRIWVMNADGSGQVQLSSQPYSEHPAWSPDGRLIAYDADANGDGWLELWLMNADGTNQNQVYDPPEAETDAWMGAWSPDGRYLAFTRISWINLQGTWYWYAAFLDALDLTMYDVVRLSSSGMDWMPSWQTVDTLPPSSTVTDLPAQSPSPIAVSWSGVDNGLAGIANYDVQVRDGPEGTWIDWRVGIAQTSASYWGGLAGHTYYFRCRARDNALNLEAWPGDYEAWTTVETLPPQTAVEPLPPYSRGKVTVTWSGIDVGGSGIATYDVQVRDGAGDWTDWQMGVATTEASFKGETGHTYYFRSRGTDRAGNTEEWPPADGDASTDFYSWAMTGTFRDNRGTPVMGGLVDLIPEALAVIPSDADGAYTAYEATVSEVYTAAYAKAGYGDLPPTAFDGSTDARADMVLPPADNIVQNWDFETGSLAPKWLAGGDVLPAITSDQFHTGGFSAALFPGAMMFSPGVNLSNGPGNSGKSAVGIDDSGTVHVVWQGITEEDRSDLFYSQREPGAGWSAPITICGSQRPVRYSGPRLVVEADGSLHVSWWNSANNFYAHRSADGAWSEPVNVSQSDDRSGQGELAVGVDGTVHMVWPEEILGFNYILYARRAQDGTWSAPVRLSERESEEPVVAVTPDGTVHVVWWYWLIGDGDIMYSQRASDGTWSAPVNVSNSPDMSQTPIVVAAGDDSLHVAWLDDSPGYRAIQYSERSSAGTWSAPQTLGAAAGQHRIALGPDGSVHLIWGGVQYARRDADGEWSLPEVVGYGGFPDLAIDSSGTAHIVWSEYLPPTDVFYVRRSAGGAWSERANVSNTPGFESSYPRLALDADNGAHIVWRDGDSPTEIFWAETVRAEETGESILSQDLTVPSTAADPTLSFLYRLEGAPAPGRAWLGVQVDDGLSSTPVFTATSWVGWSHAWIDLTPWAGQTVSLRFLVHQTEGQPVTWADLDEVSAGSAYPDVWVSKESRTHIAAHGTLTVFDLRYGNRGSVGTTGVTLIDVLPPELTFLSADPPPDSQTPQLTWVLDDLPARSGPFTIVLTTTMAPDTPPQQMVTNTASVETGHVELETLNNEASGSVWLGYPVRLPLILRFW